MLKKVISVIITLLIFSCHQSEPEVTDYKLVWEDQFSGNELDHDKWEYQIGDGSSYGLWKWGNNESQYYKKDNVSLKNGLLRIKAIAEKEQNYNYTSARIRTKGLADFFHGKIEASIKMDNTKGLWHAFWLLPSNPVEDWPMSGEIDIMEYVGNSPNEILNTVHFADDFNNHRYTGANSEFSNDNDFHKYSIEWDENKIVWYLDEKETFRILSSDPNISNNWPFNANFHILLNTAIGGNLGGEIDSISLLDPKFMEVDYVKVYQKP